MFILRLEENFLTHCPAYIESLPFLSMSGSVHDFNTPKQDYVNKLVVESLGIQGLSFCQIDYATIMQHNLDSFKSKFAENRMEVVEAQMGYIDLHILILLEHAFFKTILIELLLDLEESFLDLLLDLRFKLFLHIMHLEILALKIFERLRFLLLLIVLVIFLDGLRDFHDGLLRVIAHRAMGVYHWQADLWLNLSMTLLIPKLGRRIVVLRVECLLLRELSSLLLLLLLL